MSKANKTDGLKVKWYALDSVQRFPAFDPSVDERRTGTTFYGDFKVAEAYGMDALNETWGRVWEEWRNNAAYVIELCVVMNHLCWEHERDAELCKWYADKYYFCRSRIFSSGSEGEPLPDGCTPFTSEEQSVAFDVMD